MGQWVPLKEGSSLTLYPHTNRISCVAPRVGDHAAVTDWLGVCDLKKIFNVPN
jgi:hypothetical protein